MKWSLTAVVVSVTTLVVSVTTVVVSVTSGSVSDHFIHNLIHVLELYNLFWFYMF